MESCRLRIQQPFCKVCGFTRFEDIDAAAEAGVDMVGLNFVSSSPRFVDLALSRRLCEHAKSLGLLVAGVVMNLAPRQLTEIISTVNLDVVQLHGHELPDAVEACGGLEVIKAVSWSDRDEEKTLVRRWRDYHERNAGSNSKLIGFLVDAYSPEQGGGTGRVARWDLLWPRPDNLLGIPLILAGGLRAENVSAAILQTHCDGVDTASGVEDSPGCKSGLRMQAFTSAARHAFESLKQTH